MVNLFRGHCTAASRIDTDDYGLDVIVIRQFAKVSGHRLAHNTLFAGEAAQVCVANAAHSIVNGHLIATFLLVHDGLGHV